MNKAMLVVAVAVAVSTALAQRTVKPSIDIDKALSYPLQDLQTGEMTTLDSLRGRYKAIFIDTYASWCPDCKRAAPFVRELYNEFGSQDVLFVGLDVWDEYSKLQEHQAKYKLPYMILHDPAERKNKSDLGVTADFGVTNIPTVIILDGQTLTEKARFVDEKAAHLIQERVVLRELTQRAGNL